MDKEKIIKIITDNVEYWQPRGEMNSCFIIEDKEFFWRINPKWAEEVADKIIELGIETRRNAIKECLEEIDKVYKKEGGIRNWLDLRERLNKLSTIVSDSVWERKD